MRSLFLPFILGSILSVSGQTVPEISNLFPKGKLISIAEIDPFNKIIDFGVDLTFAEQKKLLAQALGEKWVEGKMPRPKLADDGALKAVKAAPILAGEAIFNHTEYDNVSVVISSLFSDVFGTKYATSIIVERRK